MKRHCSESAEAPSVDTSSPLPPWSPLQGLWKSRLPVVAVPILAGLQHVTAEEQTREGGYLESGLQVLLLCCIALCTGYWRLPFSVTWWLILLAAFALQTQLLLGAAAVLSLSVLCGWYGLRCLHPQAVTALWGGATVTSSAARACWQAWDFCVHGAPAVLVLYWHGPSLGIFREQTAGAASFTAVSVVLPLNVIWLWGLCLGIRPDWRSFWPGSLQLSQTELAYHVSPPLPRSAWSWVYGSHWAVCLLWGAVLVLPREVLLVYGLFVLVGMAWQPYTLGWWCLFLASLWQGGGGSYLRALSGATAGEHILLLEGICCCCAASTSLGFYGAQLLAPYAFRALLDHWLLQPAARWLPEPVAGSLQHWAESWSFVVVTRIGDCLLHLVPTSIAVVLFFPSLSAKAALAALPTNLVWLASTGSLKLAMTSKIYGVEPPLPGHVLKYLYGCHWALCGALFLFCTLRGAV
eukprot:TRINITY_DN105703_c0_g1_i1.p1 TRINITY_DN105703_c0_g1~~TRINITY_DN105703_c0_g1_i1.p1  ORF type:complete len:465 (+),score=72.82 TRINITY_DN105703_c0_g1_i1:112-1506(+)